MGGGGKEEKRETAYNTCCPQISHPSVEQAQSCSTSVNNFDENYCLGQILIADTHIHAHMHTDANTQEVKTKVAITTPIRSLN